MAFLWTNLALIAVVARVRPRLFPDGGWLAVTGAVALFTLLATGCVQLTGWFGVLGPTALVVLTTLLVVGVFAAERPFPLPEPRPREAPKLDPLIGLAAVVLAAPATVWLFRVGWNGTRFSWDDLVYHGPMPAWWVQSGSLAYAPFTYQAYYPLHAELLTAWFMAPDSRMVQAGLAVLCFAALLGASVLAVCEELEVHLATPLLLLAAFFVSPGALAFTDMVSANDLAMAAYLLAATAMAIANRPGRAGALAGVSGLCAGAALGTKISSAPVVGLLGLWWVLKARRDGNWRTVGLFAAATFPYSAWWYIRNLAVTGNPVFPAAVGPFAGPFEAEARHATTIAGFLEVREDTRTLLDRIVRKQFDWPHALSGLAAFGYVTGALRALREPGRRQTLLLVLWAGMLLALLYPFQPFSGSVNRPDAMLHSTVRFLTLPLLAGLIGLCAPRTSRLRWATAATALGMFVYVGSFTWPKLKPLEFEVGVGGVVAAAILLGATRLGPTTMRVRAVGVALPVLGILAAGYRADAKIELCADTMQKFRPRAGKQPVGKSWSTLETLPDGSRIAYISEWPASHAFYLPQFGQRLQHRPVPVDRDGSLLAPLHTRWRSDPEAWWWEWEALEGAHDEVTTLTNVLDAAADYILITRCQNARGNPWPAPREALIANGTEHRRYADACSELWDLAQVVPPIMSGFEPEDRPLPPPAKPKGKGKGKGKGKAPPAKAKAKAKIPPSSPP